MFLIIVSLEGKAATILVNSQVDEIGCNLVEAINTANNDSNEGGCTREDDGTDDVILLSEEISEFRIKDVENSEFFGGTGLPVITSKISIVGQHPGLTTILRDSDDAFRFFVVYGGDLTLENIELKNGNVFPDYNGGAIYVGLNASMVDWIFSKLTLENVQVSANIAKEGGGVYIYSGSEAFIRKSTFIDNSANETPEGGDGLGGGLRAEPILDDAPISVRIFDSTFSNNKANKSGGGINFAAFRGSTLGVFNSTFVRNHADLSGGGMFLLVDDNDDLVDTDLSNTIRVSNNIVVRNTADVAGNQIFTPEDQFENEIEILDNVIGTVDETMFEAVNTEILQDNIITTSDQGRPLALEEIIDTDIFQTSEGMFLYRLAKDSPAINAGRNYYLRLVYDPIFDVNVPHLSPGCAGERDLQRTIPEYRPDQTGQARPIGAECDIGSYESSYGDNCEQYYVVPAANDNTVVFCL